MSRTAVFVVHILAVSFLLLMIGTPISVLGYLLLAAMVAVADQGITWPLWLATDRRGPNPLQGWWK